MEEPTLPHRPCKTLKRSREQMRTGIQDIPQTRYKTTVFIFEMHLSQSFDGPTQGMYMDKNKKPIGYSPVIELPFDWSPIPSCGPIPNFPYQESTLRTG